MVWRALCRLVDSQKRGFIPPTPGYLHLHRQQSHQTPGLPQPTGTSHIRNYAPYGQPPALYPTFFPAAGGDVRPESTTISPVASTPDAAVYGSSSTVSPPTPPVTPGNRHQLPAQLHHQQLGAGHMNASVSPPGISHRRVKILIEQRVAIKTK